MKTTIDLPDALALEAKEMARETGVTLRDLVISGLRAEIASRRAAPRVDFVFPTVGGRGVSAGISPGQVIALSYGLGTDDRG